jgi:hypothetical protein
MNRTFFYLLAACLIVSAFVTRPALAQTQTPPAVPTGEVSGTIFNRNTGNAVSSEYDVMLHIMDKDFTETNMLHGRSQPNGNFVFSDVPFNPNSQFSVMAIYDGVTYFSEAAPADMTSRKVELEVPIYETTSDPSSLQVSQMHILFGFAEDGLEMKEIYILSNAGERTVKDVYKLEGDKTASLKFPLPSDADYIFFKPDDKDRFVKFNGGFADTYPVLPGAQTAQIIISYVMPYAGERTYSYTAPLDIATMNFLLPEQDKVSLQGQGLGGPERMTLQDGKAYLVYSYSNLKAGQAVSISIRGRGESNTKSANAAVPFAIGLAGIGLVVVSTGIWWWWRKSDNDEDESADEGLDDETDLDQIVNEIARLDLALEKREIDEDQYRDERKNLRKKAKALLAQNEARNK